jgi:hypothetical protein
MADPAERPKINPRFEVSERLYRRIPLADVEANFVSNASIPLPAFSVDRETYLVNGPADTLKGYQDMGLAWFCVGHIPLPLESGSGELFGFGVEHKPIEGNPAHSEVLAYKDGVEVSKLPDGVKKKFRDALRLKIQIL